MRLRVACSFVGGLFLVAACSGPSASVAISCGGMPAESAELNTNIEITLDDAAASAAGRITVELTRTSGRTEVEMDLAGGSATCSGDSREYRVSLTGGRVPDGALTIATPSPAQVVVQSEGSVIAERLYDPDSPTPEPLEWTAQE